MFTLRILFPTSVVCLFVHCCRNNVAYLLLGIVLNLLLTVLLRTTTGCENFTTIFVLLFVPRALLVHHHEAKGHIAGQGTAHFSMDVQGLMATLHD